MASAPAAHPGASPATGVRGVALMGNPNVGKTTLFNALTGFRAKVANYPGVTVDKRSGPLRGVPGVEVLDLPGTYSLAARSPDEMVAVDVLLGRRTDTPRPAAAIVVLDASNLERNLYLATQVVETGVPVVLALNMTDVAAARGHAVDAAALSRAIGAPVVPLVASRGDGVPALVSAVEAVLAAGTASPPAVRFPDAFEAEARSLAAALSAAGLGALPAFEVRRILLDVGGHAEARAAESGGPAVREAVHAARARLAEAGAPVEGLEAALRYDAIAGLVDGSVTRPAAPRVTASDRIDAFLTHRVLGVVAFAAVMTLVFLSIFSWSGPAMDAIDGLFAGLGEAIESSGWLASWPALESLVVRGVIGGVGAVLVFLPQILVLFAFLAVLEDCGYMARAAFVMDRLLRWCGLSGKAFLPMLSSFACAIPGILATRTIESRRERFATILVAPLMSCSARIPVYLLMIGAFVPATTLLGFVDSRALVFTALYLVGIAVAIPVAWLLKATVLRGEPSPFLLELPPYRVPRALAVLQRMWGAGREFLVRASTLILATSVVIWALSWFPRDARVGEDLARAEASAAATRDAALAAAPTPEAKDAAVAAHDAAVSDARAHAEGEWMRGSWLGTAGKAVEPVFEPIGWDWKVSVAVIASFPAREVVVGTLGVLYDVGDPEADEGATLRQKLQAAKWEDGPRKGQPVFDLASALALAVFFALCLQCVSTLAVMRRETGAWRWPLFGFAYLTVLAWLGAFATATVVRGLS